MEYLDDTDAAKKMVERGCRVELDRLFQQACDTEEVARTRLINVLLQLHGGVIEVFGRDFADSINILDLLTADLSDDAMKAA